MAGPSKPFRGGVQMHGKRVVADHHPQPEFTIPTEDNFTIDLDDEIHALKYDPRTHVDGVKQWVNRTRPIREPFDGDVEAVSDSLPVHCDAAPSVSAADSADSLEEKWRQREFDRVYAQLAHQYELRHAGDKLDARKINEKVVRYKKAFLKGFYEARIRRIETNKWLYERLHVNADHIREKYRQLMYVSEPEYVTVPTDGDATAMQPHGVSATQQLPPFSNAGMAAADEPEPREADKDELLRSVTGPGTCEDAAAIDDDLDDASVYSFTPERDNVLLQDVNTPPQIRGFGHDKHRKYDPKVRLLHLQNWVSPEIERWMDERKLNEAMSDTESDHPDEEIDNHPKARKEDLKYEEIRGATEMPKWLGPKKLDERELDLENFRKLSADEADAKSVAKEEKDERKVPPGADEERGDGVDDAASVASKAISETPSKCLLRQLVQSQSKDYYKLWYATHDTYNTTPFLEARLQRLMREILGRREWAMYCEYLKNKDHEKGKYRTNDGMPQ